MRTITEPVADTVLVAVNGAAEVLGTHFSVNTTTGVVTFSGPALFVRRPFHPADHARMDHVAQDGEAELGKWVKRGVHAGRCGTN